MDNGLFFLIAVWLTAPTEQMRELGLSDVMYIRRFETLRECIKRRDEYRNSPDRLNPDIKVVCVDASEND